MQIRFCAKIQPSLAFNNIIHEDSFAQLTAQSIKL